MGKLLCIKCKEKEVDCFNSCDKCQIGLCKVCNSKYAKLLSETINQKIKNCNICKTDFYDFCEFCHDQTLQYMLYHKLKDFKDDSNMQRILCVSVRINGLN